MSACTLGGNSRLRFFSVIAILMLTLGFSMVSPVLAQYCMESNGYPTDYFDSSFQGCLGRPSIPRAYHPTIWSYHSTERLLQSDGNQLRVYSLDNPANPSPVASSNYLVTHQGDSDYDLNAYLVCDECRYAMLPYKVQTIFVDLGDPAANVLPAFTNFVRTEDIQAIEGGLTFKYGSTQYLISDGLTGQCGDNSALFEFNSTDPATIAGHFRGCVQTGTGAGISVQGGLYLQNQAYNGGTPYLWLSSNSRVYVFRGEGSGTSFHLSYVQTVPDLYSTAFGSHTIGMAVDYEQGIAVSINPSQGLVFWEFPNHDLSSPVKTATFPSITGSVLSLSYPLLWTAKYGALGTGRTLRITGDVSSPSVEDLSYPAGASMSFWDPSQSWNDLTCSPQPFGATFSPDGRKFYIARYAEAQTFDMSACGGPQIPTAHVKIDKWNGSFWTTLSGNPFPGDRIRVSSTSAGEIDSTTITLKDASGATVDTSSGASTATPIDYTIPVGGGQEEPSPSYTAIVEASNTEGSDTDQSVIPVDRSPGATIETSPQAPIVNDNLTLSATAEGSPGIPAGLDITDAFEWIITAPDQTQEPTLWGAEPIDPVLLDQSGLWSIQLNVYYRHLEEGGTATYVSTTTRDLNISTVAAAISVTPANPINTANVVLDGSSSRWATGDNLPSWTWEYKAHAATSWTQLTSCADQQTCTIPGSESSQTLDPGSYDFRLTLGLGQDSDTASALGIEVANGLVNYDVTVNNTNPDKGEAVTFSLTNIGSVDEVRWTFGEAGCDLPSVVTCTPTFTNCLSQAFTYQTSGSKNVSVSVKVNNQDYPLTKNNILTVSTSGSCSGGSCSYSVSPTSWSAPADGGSKTFAVSTSSGCSWSASESASWLRVTSGSSGIGSGSVLVSADANTGTSSRSTTMVIAGRNVSVTQAAPACSYTLTPESRDVPAAGGAAYTIWVGTTSSCSWTATSNASWVSLQAGTTSGTGNGQVKYDVAENETGSARTAIISIGNQRHTINQDAPIIPVDFTMSPDTADIGQAVRFQVSDPRIKPVRWEFGGENCAGVSTFECAFAEEYCRDITWNYATAGWYSVRLVAEQGEKSHGGLHILPSGECCYKDGVPRADFTMSPNPVFTRETVTFTDASSKAAGLDGAGKTSGVGFSWAPVSPEIGQTFMLTITGVGSVSSASWDFGEAGCELEQTISCVPGQFANCMTQGYAYASAGQKTVKLTINGNQSVTQTLTVQNQGTCGSGGGGGGGCTYSLAPTTKSFGENGGTASVSVSTQDGCSWTASETASWITITSGAQGQGSGSFSYSVSPNSGGARTVTISAGGRKHTVSQDAHYEPQDTAPTAWQWTISLDGKTVVTSDQPDFSYEFRDPGIYLVRLEASNCAGSDIKEDYLQVDQAPVVIPDAYVVPSAVHAPGLNDTQWRTDLRVFNPDEHPVDIVIEYQPENTDNSATVNHGIVVTIPPHNTRAANDILQLIPGVIGNDDGSGSFVGSLSVTYQNGGHEAVPPMIMSRTYNETSNGSFGQFVPAAPAIAAGGGELFLSGLVSNIYYRTNVRMANLGEQSAVVELQLLDKNGNAIGDPIYPEVLPRSTRQVNGIAAAAGVSTSLDIFSVRATSENEDIRVWVSIVDNSTGDPVLYAPMIPNNDSSALWIPGLAHLPGANGSQWYSDMVFFNNNPESVNADVNYIASENLGIQPYMRIRGLEQGMALYYVDILGNSLLPYGVDSKGYLVIRAEPGSSLPAVAGKTYNEDPDGGTFGQNLFVFQDKDLIEEGGVCYLPGIATSPDAVTGFRTNLGILNTNEESWTSISLKALDENAEVLGQIDEMWLDPAKFLQFNLADRIDLHDAEHLLTVEITVLSGGPIGAYASEVDNRTQDPILIPAQKVLKK